MRCVSCLQRSSASSAPRNKVRVGPRLVQVLMLTLCSPVNGVQAVLNIIMRVVYVEVCDSGKPKHCSLDNFPLALEFLLRSHFVALLYMLFILLFKCIPGVGAAYSV
jgi:hypothetical protein